MILQLKTPRMELWRIDGPFANVPHTHDDDYQITVPMYGTCHFTMENRNYRLADGGGLVQHPKERHVFEIGEKDGVYIFKVGQEGLGAFARRDSLELDLKQQFDRTLLAGRFRGWMDALLTHAPKDRLAIEEVESQVYGYLCGAMSGNHRDAGLSWMPDDRAAAAVADPYMKRVLEYVHEHYADEITVEELAAIAMRSRFHFIRTFKAAFGTTPYQYVLRLRIEEAKRLLRRTDRSVTDIGLSLGFASVSAFHRAFAKAVGRSPEQYRLARKAGCP